MRLKITSYTLNCTPSIDWERQIERRTHYVGRGRGSATRAQRVIEHIRYLCRHSRRPVSVQPNAGLPEIRDGLTYYPLQPDEFVSHLETFVDELAHLIAHIGVDEIGTDNAHAAVDVVADTAG